MFEDFREKSREAAELLYIKKSKEQVADILTSPLP